MCPPEDIPEDREESFPCPECALGSVEKDKDGLWGCDSCTFVPESKAPEELSGNAVYIG
jgi:ribosomal protein L37AE/L43A